MQEIPGAANPPRAGCAPDAHLEVDAARGDLATALVQLTRMIQGLHAQVSEQHDLTPVQAKLLCVLLDGPTRMADLARGFGVERAALTGLVDRAERRGLVERTPVPGDRRALHVLLTDEGRRAAAAFHAEVTAQLDRLTASWNTGDRTRFHSLVIEILSRVATDQS
ncbi:MarR family transcriptional regulator [Nocardia sp. NPDC050710]|uniref:MarR family winged helix-turn-helix transcriptional regulator n=1 Tax=Nocardia sp. NPDC050710 TaxID=3157220 RepID=UPI0033D63F6D